MLESPLDRNIALLLNKLAAVIMVSLRMNTSTQHGTTVRVDTLLLEVADVVNATLDLDTLLRRVSELIRRVIDYEIFAILLLMGTSFPLASFILAGWLLLQGFLIYLSIPDRATR